MDDAKLDIKSSVKGVLDTIDRDREKEIISRRFGLYGRRETLEQIGEMLGITRERVRQLEKAILIRLRIASEEGKLEQIDEVEKEFIKHLSETGRVAKTSDLATKVGETGDERDQAHVAFLATLIPSLVTIDENDDYHHAIAIKEHHDAKQVKVKVNDIVKTIKKHGKPITVDELHSKLDGHEHPSHVEALSGLSKNLAKLKDMWGHIKWPLVNPRNIRDKIYVVLQDKQKPLHFSEIAQEISKSDFARKDVTTQAIHNELIKDKRFVLIGRGIYALKEWGYSSGTVSDIIEEVLKDAGKPVHRNEIVKQVLRRRQVKETTILLNLQNRDRFVRVGKDEYTLSDDEPETNPEDKKDKPSPKDTSKK